MSKSLLVIAFLLAATAPTYCQDYWQLFFQPEGAVEHEALLFKSSSGLWKMRVRFYSETCSCYDVIEQKMRRENTSDGFRLAGYDPYHANTQRDHDSYVADNLYFEEDEDGDTIVTNRDDAGVETTVYGITQIEDNAALRRLLTKFKWD